MPARVFYTDGGWTKSSIKAWPRKASPNIASWPDGWFTWGGDWHVALCPRVGGLVALDCDGPEAVDALRQSIKRNELPWTGTEWAYRTPGHGGGMHVIWRWPTTLPSFSRCAVTLPDGGQLDLRGESTFLLLFGAPRPDVSPAGATYEVVSSPDPAVGPPDAPNELPLWLRKQGEILSLSASVDVRQLSLADCLRMAEQQGGKIKTDRHTTLFRLASWWRVRDGGKTFEELASSLWNVVNAHFDLSEEGDDAWMKECVRVAQNAINYTKSRDEEQMAAAKRWVDSMSKF